MNFRVSVFTPTFNRAYIINKLYNSLCLQTCKDFEWIIVDDGSTDNTQDVIQSFINEEKIDIQYLTQPNGGKHRAINLGVQMAQGELFFIVDSDDQLTENAIEQVLEQSAPIIHDSAFAGVCGLKYFFDGRRVGGKFGFTSLDCNSFDFRYKYKVKGDMAEVIKTEVMREFPFPEFAGEKFCSEAVLWNRIAVKYKLRYFNEKIYLCDYLADGLTASIVKIRMNSPQASMLCYDELFHAHIPLIQKFKAAINYWRFSACTKISYIHSIKKMGWGTIFLPIGHFYHFVDSRL